MKKKLLPFIISCALASSFTSSISSAQPLANENTASTAVTEGIWKDDTQKMDAFISELIAKMTLKEKIGQLDLQAGNGVLTGAYRNKNYVKQIKAGHVGAIFNTLGADRTRALQKIAVEETRLGIPLLFGYDVIHGHKTIFPISLGEAASWDLEAIEKSARVSAKEAAAEGLHWTFAPMVDVSRDPRWGRISEGAGEDVYLGTQVALARVQGFQGDDLSEHDTIMATAKHFAAYGAAEGGRDYNSTDMSERTLRTTYLPPFKALVDSGVATFMTAFNDLNGVPATGSEYLLNEILRDEWGFEGFVVTDYTAVEELVDHGFAKDSKHAAELALNAGADMDMVGQNYFKHLEASVKEGKVTEATIDKSVRRILEMKYRLGLFEDPYRYSDMKRQKAEILSKENLLAAQDVARKSMVLLKNKDQTLPLSSKLESIALIGPLANSKTDMIGSWAGAGDRKTQPVTVLEGLKAKLGGKVKINFAKGASYNYKGNTNKGFGAAMVAAKKSDVIVVAMGESQKMTGEASSRTSLTLPGNQLALLRELKKLKKPIVMVLMNGRPLNLNWADANVDAILETWYSGTMAGHAIADVLVGDYNPSGKLPMSFPRNVGQIPVYHSMKNTGRPFSEDLTGGARNYSSRYENLPNTPLYAFGYGLSYTTFEYGDIKLSSNTMTVDGSIEASVKVTNTGDYDGEEVVQLYIQDLVGSVTRPVKELKGFQKLMFKKGESKTVKFTITEADLAFYRKDMSFGAEEGEFKLFIGTASDNNQEKSFSLVEK
ncbi:MAG: glycoside hydrolase family 3 C-terminal domain-containing protein [Colwellia sp.]|nr:glycoside hydrolase family 3 C-terminal domain-containing protein [Colwellia sp.]MCW8863667.1 glycoside hydrolase family 3 C-terminal domain-containing protein [Colwellia sp.]MCW9082271.1 glycoside hydrolase family 3 C-terminal domain-containing protein [Colwellia sp.]